MAELNVCFIASLSFLLLFLVTLWRFLSLKKENALLAEQLTETTVSLERTRRTLAKLQEKHEEILGFQNSLEEAELTTRLQKPRLHEMLSPSTQRNTPEKYSYIHSLAEKGLSVEEIAAILTISTHEARQLVNLAKIAQGN